MNQSLEIVKHVKMEIEENLYRQYLPIRLAVFVANWFMQEVYYWNFQKQETKDYIIMNLKMKRNTKK